MSRRRREYGATLEKRLAVYGVAAGSTLAAGCLAQSAHATLIVNNPTGTGTPTTSQNGSIYFDITTGQYSSNAFPAAQFELTNFFSRTAATPSTFAESHLRGSIR